MRLQFSTNKEEVLAHLEEIKAYVWEPGKGLWGGTGPGSVVPDKTWMDCPSTLSLTHTSPCPCL